NNLAALYEAQGQYAEAESLFTRSLTILEKTLSPNHPKVIANLNNLAELYRKSGREIEAAALKRRASVE
ncbi:MAG TPA: tetratricopeptide repeat protein, partial [Nitrosospira sp.]